MPTNTEVNGDQLTKHDSENPMSQAEMETAIIPQLIDVETVSSSDITAPNPVNVAPTDIVKKATTQVIATGALSEITAGGPAPTTFTEVLTTDEITKESLNRTAKTLSESIDQVMANYASDFSTASNHTISQVKVALNKIVTDTNAGFSNIKSQADDQIVEIDSKIDSIVNDVNTAFEDVRVKNLSQNHDIATKINEVSGQNNTNVRKLEAAILAMDKKLRSIDDVYLTDADMAERITAINGIIETLRGSDMDVVTTLASINNEVNNLTRVDTKEVIMNNGNGMYNFNLSAEQFKEMPDADRYQISAHVVGDVDAQVSVINKTKDGADLMVKSNGVHFVPQPVDGSVKNVKLLVEVTYRKINPLTFNVDTLDDAWLTDGNGTDNNAV